MSDDNKPRDGGGAAPVGRAKSPPVEEVHEPETLPIVMAPTLPPSPLATPRDESRRDVGECTKPFELPPKQAITPAQGIPAEFKPSDTSTKPLAIPPRTPAPVEVQPVTVELVEETTGVLTVADELGKPVARSSSADISAAIDALRADGRPSDKAITVELVEEHSGVLSLADDKGPAKPLTATAGPVGNTSSHAAKPAAAPASAATAAALVGDTSGDAATAAAAQTSTATAAAAQTSTATAAAAPQADASTQASSRTGEPAGDAAATSPADVALADLVARTPEAAAASTSAGQTRAAPSSPAPSDATGAGSTADDVEESVTSSENTIGKSDEDMVPWVAPDDGFLIADESGKGGLSAPLVPSPPILPSPQAAALEAARIVSRIVDIESESGAVIAAAAAAGAAIEAAVAAQKVLDPRASQPNLRIPPELTAAQASSADPITTVRLSRDRILAALAEEDIAVPATARDARVEPTGRVRAAAVSDLTRGTDSGVDEEAYEEFDPVTIAAAAIGRLRARARTDLAELRVHYHRHDILVLLLALVIIIVAGRVHAHLVTPPTELFSEHGLTFRHATTWLKPEPMPPIAPRLVRDPTGAQTKDDSLYHVEFSAVGSTAKLEVLIDKKPTWSNVVTGLELDRRSRWGELYTLDDSSVKSIAGHDWLRTAYRYAHVADKGDVPRVDHAVEYATIDREQIYVLTVYGTPAELEQIEDVIAPSLRVPSQTGLPLVPQTGRLSQRKYPGPVGRAFESTVMVVVADLVNGRLQARGGGSGVIVGADGSILTNYHVIHDKDGRLHDVFVIGRFTAPDRAPQLQCAGRPSRSKLLRDLDLALVKCDMDLDGRTWSPSSSGIWATLPEARAADVKIGQRLWVLGYPDVGGGGLTLNVGEVEGWTGEDGAQGKDFIKTDASITHGNSGGPVIDDYGKLVGIATAFRTRVTANGGVIETAQVGLVRPLQAASNLLAYAAAGWTPREGYTDVELTPSAVEAAAEGIRIFTTVIDDANEQPVRDATVMVLKPGINTATIDMNRIDDQAIAWGKTNALGEVRLKQLVPVGDYTVMVVAPGYEPLIGENELHLDDRTPPSFDPWGKIGLRSR